MTNSINTGPLPSRIYSLTSFITSCEARRSFPSTLTAGIPAATALAASVLDPDSKWLGVEIAHWLLLIVKATGHL